MDSKAQQLIRVITLFILLLAGIKGNGQCSDSIRIIKTDTCQEQKVVMPLNKFTEFYVAWRNLRIISETNQLYRSKLDSLRDIRSKELKTFEKELVITNKKYKITSFSLNECRRTIVDVEKENYTLQDKIKKEVKLGNKKFVLGLFLGGSTIYGLTKLFGG